MCVLNCCADEINVCINRQLYPLPMLWQILLGVTLSEQESRLVYAYDKTNINTDLQTLNCTLRRHIPEHPQNYKFGNIFNHRAAPYFLQPPEL